MARRLARAERVLAGTSTHACDSGLERLAIGLSGPWEIAPRLAPQGGRGSPALSHRGRVSERDRHGPYRAFLPRAQP